MSLSPAARGTSAVRHAPVSSSSSSESSPALRRSAMAESGGGAELDAACCSGIPPESESDSVPETAAAFEQDATCKAFIGFFHKRFKCVTLGIKGRALKTETDLPWALQANEWTTCVTLPGVSEALQVAPSYLYVYGKIV